MIKKTFVLVLLAAPLLGGDWPDWSLNPARTRVSPEEIGTSLSVIWSKDVATEIVASPVTADGYVVIGTKDGSVWGLSESDGTTKWSFDAGGQVMGTPSVRNGTVYAATRDGDLYALRLVDGTSIWSVSLGGSAYSSPQFVDGTLVIGIGAPGGAVRAIDPDTGATVWQTSLDGSAYSSVAVEGTSLWVGATPGKYYRLDADTGDLLSTIDTNGDILLSSPLVAFDQVFAAPGGVDMNFYSLDSWSLSLSDPSPPTVGTILRTRLDTSSPMVAGSLVCVVVRFDYYIDTTGNGRTDTFVIQEHAVAIDPVAQTQAWQVLLGSNSGSSQNVIPTLGMCPTPSSMDGGARLVVGCAVEGKLRILDAASGAVLFSYSTDAPGRSSPIVSNGRILWGTDGGTLWSFQGAANQPPLPPASGFNPEDGGIPTIDVTTLAWNAAYDPNDPPDNLRYVVRIDDDDEILNDWDEEVVTPLGAPSATLGTPAVAPHTYTYAVRTEDGSGARSPWSAPQTFTVAASVRPPPPVDLAATPSVNAVLLQWTASPSPGVSGYNIRWAPPGQPLGAPTFTFDISRLVNELINELVYHFEVRAVDEKGDESAPVTVQAMPTDMGIISVNGFPFASLDLAIAAALPGDAIQVGRGTFAVPLGLTLEGVSLIGISPHDTWLDAEGMSTAIWIINDTADSPMWLENFSVFGAEVGIEVDSGTVSVSHLVVRDMADDGIRISGAAAVADIVNNTILNNGGAGVAARDGSAVVRNNILIQNGTGLWCSSVGIVINTYNDVFGNAPANYDGCEAGEGDIAWLVEFVGEAGKDFRVAVGQISIDAGDPASDYSNEPMPNGGRINQGAYGNTTDAAKLARSLDKTANTGPLQNCSLGAVLTSTQPVHVGLALMMFIMALGVARGCLAVWPSGLFQSRGAPDTSLGSMNRHSASDRAIWMMAFLLALPGIAVAQVARANVVDYNAEGGLGAAPPTGWVNVGTPAADVRNTLTTPDGDECIYIERTGADEGIKRVHGTQSTAFVVEFLLRKTNTTTATEIKFRRSDDTTASTMRFRDNGQIQAKDNTAWKNLRSYSADAQNPTNLGDIAEYWDVFRGGHRYTYVVARSASSGGNRDDMLVLLDRSDLSEKATFQAPGPIHGMIYSTIDNAGSDTELRVFLLVDTDSDGFADGIMALIDTLDTASLPADTTFDHSTDFENPSVTQTDANKASWYRGPGGIPASNPAIYVDRSFDQDGTVDGTCHFPACGGKMAHLVLNRIPGEGDGTERTVSRDKRHWSKRIFVVSDKTLYKINADPLDVTDDDHGNQRYGQSIWTSTDRDFEWRAPIIVQKTITQELWVLASNDTGAGGNHVVVKMDWDGNTNPGVTASWSIEASAGQDANKLAHVIKLFGQANQGNTFVRVAASDGTKMAALKANNTDTGDFRVTGTLSGPFNTAPLRPLPTPTNYTLVGAADRIEKTKDNTVRAGPTTPWTNGTKAWGGSEQTDTEDDKTAVSVGLLMLLVGFGIWALRF